LFVLVAAAGLQFLYWTFFSAFVVACGAAIGWIRSGDRRSLRWGFVALAAMIGVFLVSNIPGMFTWAADPATRDHLEQMKSPAEADIYHLVPRQLILPSASSSLPPLAAVGKAVRAASMPLDMDPMRIWPRLGLVGTMGLAVLLLGVCGLRRPADRAFNRLLTVASALTACLFLLATAGGLGSVFNIFVSSQIRAYIRSVSFIGWLAIAAGCLAALRLIPAGRSRWVAAAGLLAIGLIDQTETSHLKGRYKEDQRIHRGLSSLVGRLERDLPEGSAVFQLPLVSFPATPVVHKLPGDHHLRAYAVSSRLKWSWPPFTARSVVWQRMLNGLAEEALCRRLALAGFSALWLDRDGYPDGGKELEQRLTALVGPPMAELEYPAIVVFDLRRYARQIESSMTQAELRKEREEAMGPKYLWGTPISFRRGESNYAESIFLRGLSSPEPEFTWTDGRVAAAIIEVVPTNSPVDLVVDGLPVGATARPFPVHVTVDGCKAGSLLYPDRRTLTLRIPAGCIAGKPRFRLGFGLPEAVSLKGLGLSGDPRLLGLAIYSMTLTPAGAGG
jgi:phosphoglycerol transferase